MFRRTGNGSLHTVDGYSLRCEMQKEEQNYGKSHAVSAPSVMRRGPSRTSNVPKFPTAHGNRMSKIRSRLHWAIVSLSHMAHVLLEPGQLLLE